jgi:hypothetical protein
VGFSIGCLQSGGRKRIHPPRAYVLYQVRCGVVDLRYGKTKIPTSKEAAG